MVAVLKRLAMVGSSSPVGLACTPRVVRRKSTLRSSIAGNASSGFRSTGGLHPSVPSFSNIAIGRPRRFPMATMPPPDRPIRQMSLNTR